jgi:DNA invertase Pin-like site-specific DNA recombinase
MRKAFGYLRVSGKDQVAGDGFPRQRENIERWAAANGVTIVQWFEEKGVTGTIADRPALSAMMVELMSDGVKLVVVEKLDRLARDQMVQETIIQALLKQGFELVSAASGEQDLCGNDPGRKLMRTIMGAIAEYDKTMIVLKLKAARQRNRMKHGRCEGAKPYGAYDGEQAVIARIRDLRAAGGNYEAIARQLNAEGVQSRKGGKWYPANVRRVLIA